MAKKTKKIEKIVDTDKELVDFVIKEIPNLFDAIPRGSISRPAVEKFIRELKEKQ